MNHSLISNCNSLSFLANEPSRNLGPNYTSSRIEFTMYFHFTLLSDNNKSDRPKQIKNILFVFSGLPRTSLETMIDIIYIGLVRMSVLCSFISVTSSKLYK